jgi:IPT/TIG domain/Quinohemoprotein amine dehydrogenase, alpha subunit domain III
MKTALTNLATRRRTLVLVLIAALAASTAAWAYWAAKSSGSATGKVGALSSPTVSGATGGAESVALSWSSVSAPGSGPVKYYVSRDGSTPSGTCPTSSAPSTVTSCTDTDVSAGEHSYTVTAVWRSWSSTSSAKSATTTSKPTVVSASPGSRGQGASAQAITITGSHFLSGASVAFSGTGVTVNSTTFKSSTELTASVTIAAGATTGARNITVTNPDSATGTGTAIFTVNAAPSVETGNPGSRGQGASSQTVAIKGKNFVTGATSSFGPGITVNSTTFKSSTELTANITIEASASAGVRSVSVTNPDFGVGSASAFTVNAGPAVTSAGPSSRPQGATFQTVTIKGAGFVSGATPSFGPGVTVNSTTFKSSGELSVKISVESGASTGARTVAVTNPDTGTGSLANAFTVNAAPNVESISPSSRAQGTTGQTVTIKGTGFASGASASFSGSSITVESTTFVSSTELTAKVSISSFASTGARTVTVTNLDGGSDSLAGAFTVDARPNIESTNPSSGDRGGTETVAIKGTGFASGASSSFGSGIAVNSTTFKSSTELIASVTIEAGASLGSRTVTETNPDGGSDTAESAFTVNGTPTVTSTSPSSRAQGVSSQTVAIKGTNFESGTGLVASFSGTGITVNSTSFVSSTEINANITIASNASTGVRNVSVTNPDTTSASGTGIFTVDAPPTVTSTSPGSRSQGASKQTIAIKGTGFAGGASASFGAGITVESTSFVSSTELSTKISIEAGASTGARTVSVTNSDGGTGSLASAFTVISAPNVTSTSPSSGDRGGTETVLIKGTGFASGATSSFGSGITINSTTFKSSTELAASITLEAGANLGSRTVTVTNADGGLDTAENAFTVNGAPTVTSTSPSARAQGASSQTVAIKGTNFESGTGLAASFSGTGITVNSTSFVSATEVSANVSIAANASTGARNVTVTNPDTTSAAAAGAFTVNAPPSVTSTSPNSRGQGASGQTIAIKGSGFASGATSSFGSGITVESTSFVSSTELKAKISIESGASTGSRTVTVTNLDGGVGSLVSAFTVNAGPSISTPTSSFQSRVKITHGASGEFKVTGSGFVSGATVSISGGFTLNSTTFVNSGELKVKVQAEGASQKGKYGITVTNPDGGSDTSEEAIENT